MSFRIIWCVLFTIADDVSAVSTSWSGFRKEKPFPISHTMHMLSRSRLNPSPHHTVAVALIQTKYIRQSTSLPVSTLHAPFSFLLQFVVNVVEQERRSNYICSIQHSFSSHPFRNETPLHILLCLVWRCCVCSFRSFNTRNCNECKINSNNKKGVENVTRNEKW